MANELRARRGRSGNGGGRNNAPNAGRLDKLRKVRGGFDLTGVDSKRLLNAIELAIVGGGALRIGLTRDGGALAVGVYADGASETVYLNADDDQTQFWDDIDAVFTDPPKKP
jgi:hypothetical protein